MERGRRRLEIGRYPVHFYRDGKFHDIDLTPVQDQVSGIHNVRDCPYFLQVAHDTPAYHYNSRDGKRVSVELDGVKAAPIVEGGLFKWQGIANGVDYIIQPHNAGCSTLLILDAVATDRKWQWKIDGDMQLIRPLSGHDANYRPLELIETRDKKRGILQIEWTGRVLDRGNTRRKNKQVYSDSPIFPVVIDPVVNENIAAGGDDAGSVWSFTGAIFSAFLASSTRISIGRNGSYHYYGGFRFQTIPIPAGVTVNSATLTLRVIAVVGSPNLNFHGNDVDDAAAWANPGNRMKNITQTTAVVNDSTWTGAADNTVTVTTIIAEILARAGWASNNDIGITARNTGGTGGSHLIVVAMLEHATLTEPRLSIDYTDPPRSLVPFRSPNPMNTLLRR